MSWNGKKNGELLALMLLEKFDAFLTFDKNLQYQQNIKHYSLPVLVLNASDNSYITLSKLVPKIEDMLKTEKVKEYEKSLKPMSSKDLYAMIDDFINDVKKGKLSSQEDFKKKIKSWK